MLTPFLSLGILPSNEQKACIYHWGNECSRLKASFTKLDHYLGGDPIKCNYSDSCDFRNFWHAASNYLHVSCNKREWYAEQFRLHKENPLIHKAPPEIRIAKHHFPIELLLSQMNGSISKGRITLPLSKATTDAIHLYHHRSRPPQDDGLIRYNIALGKGKSAKWLSHNPGIHFRKVPCAELRSVQDILRTERGECILVPRLDINQRRQQHAERQWNNRSPQQWNDVVVDNEERIRQLEEDIQSMMRQLQEKDTALNRAADNERNDRLNFGNEKKMNELYNHQPAEGC